MELALPVRTICSYLLPRLCADMLGRLLALFLIMPVVELALLVQVDNLIGFWPTIGLIVATGILGSYMARREGMSVWKRFNARLGQGGLPGQELLDGVIILIAGALLITPGVLTDVFGFLGLFPATRRFIRKIAFQRIQKGMSNGAISVVGFGMPPQNSPGQAGTEEPKQTWQGAATDVPRYTQQNTGLGTP